MTVNADANKLLLYLFCSLVHMGKGGGELQMFLKKRGGGMRRSVADGIKKSDQQS